MSRASSKSSIFTMGWKCALWASPRLIIQSQVSPNFGPSPWLIIFGSARSTDISYTSRKRALQRRNKWPNRPSHTATLYMFYCGLWPIRCRRGSKTNKSNCQAWKKSTYYLLSRQSQLGFIWPETTVIPIYPFKCYFYMPFTYLFIYYLFLIPIYCL
jgi:hypothetical protein